VRRPPGPFSEEHCMKKLKVSVVGGCGHVGLPLSIALAPHHDVAIYDIDPNAVAKVQKGVMPFKDEGGEEGLTKALAGGMEGTTSPEVLTKSDVVVVVVGTPVDEHLNPSFNVFDRLLSQLSEVLRPGQTVVLRSTVYPGTSERVQKYFQRRNLDVEVA